MILKYFYIFFFFIGYINNKKINQECLISNVKYKNEYLYSSNYHIKLNGFVYRRRVYSNSPNIIDQFDQLKWTLIQVNNQSDTFYFKNLEHNEYLCSSDFHIDILNHRRIIILLKLNFDFDKNDKKCMWSIKKSNKDQTRFFIWNKETNEALYSVSDFLITLINTRPVFTWYKKPDSEKFLWNIFCK